MHVHTPKHQNYNPTPGHPIQATVNQGIISVAIYVPVVVYSTVSEDNLN